MLRVDAVSERFLVTEDQVRNFANPFEACESLLELETLVFGNLSQG